MTLYLKVKRNLVVKRNPPKNIIFPEKNLGGHLPNPPGDCERKDLWRNYRGTVWIDLSICHTCSLIKECKSRSEYLKAIKLLKTKKE